MFNYMACSHLGYIYPTSEKFRPRNWIANLHHYLHIYIIIYMTTIND